MLLPGQKPLEGSYLTKGLKGKWEEPRLVNSKISRWLGVGFGLCLVRSFLDWVLELMVFWI